MSTHYIYMTHNLLCDTESRHLCSHTAVIVVLTSQPGHSCWPAGSVEHFGLMSASTWEGGDLCVIQRGFPCFYDGENIVPPLSRWHTVPPGYHYCSGYYIFSCLDHVFFYFFYFFNGLLSVVSLKYFHIPKCVVMTYHSASLKSSLLIFNYCNKKKNT